VTPTLAVAYTITFLVVFVTSLFSSHDALVAWGANVGARTANGEWWRLITSLFIPAGPLHLIACIVGLFPLGRVLERLVGSLAFAGVYLTAGVFAGLALVAINPTAVNAGASAAICGVYGFASTTLVWGFLFQKPRLIVPWDVLKWLACAGLIFFAYSIAADTVTRQTELTGFVAGVVCGLALAKGIGQRAVPVKRTAALLALAGTMAVVVAIPLHGITDVRPAIDRMMATDERTAATFRAAARQLVLGRTTEKAMIDLIEREIIPDLERERPNMSGRVVPDDQRALVVASNEYLQLRIQSWRLRATAYRRGSLAMLRQADTTEGAARDVLTRIPPG
jgi:rhomboid protease GluP